MAGVELAPHIVRRAPPVFLSLFFSVAHEVDAHREHACDSADPQQSYVFQQIHGWSPTIW